MAMFGRQVAAALRLPLPARLTHTVRFQWQRDVCARSLFTSSRRLYATPGRPRTAVGEPSKTIKRSVKKTASKTPKDGDSAAVKQVKEKKASAAKKKKNAVAKPKKKAPKKLTEQQVAAKKAKTQKDKIKALKAVALKPPRGARTKSAWMTFFSENMRNAGLGGAGPEMQARVRDHVKGLGEAYRALTPAEREHYNHLAHTESEKISSEYKQWVESRSVDEIEAANRARMHLNRLLQENTGPDAKRRTPKYPQIRDDRYLKRPSTAYTLFTTERLHSADFTSIMPSEKLKLVSNEWKALSEGEKKKYNDLAAEEKERYRTEYQALHGRAPGSPKSSAAAA